MNAVELLREIVRIPSESRQEDAVVARLQSAMLELGMAPKQTGRNLTALLDGGDGPLLLLNSHTDTVPVGQGWTRDPLKADIENGRIYGRGSNDAKGCLVAMMMGAQKAFASNAPKGKVLIAATCEEEVLGQGLEVLLPTLPRPDAAVVGEPTGLKAAVAQKGLLLLEIIAKGRSAHAAHGGGINAVEAAARDVLALSKINFDRAHPALGATTLHVTQITGGERHNVIPDRCKIVVDIRTTPSVSPEEIISLVKKAVEGEVVVRSNRLGSVETDPTHPIVEAALAANPSGQAYGSPTLSDWVFLKGIPTVKAGPGDSKRSHTPDEYLEVAELEAGVDFYEKLIRTYFAKAAA
ncbi:MAG: peptidase M20 [Elusimicrobia bacterium CG11_big_fil_rev_8_21_14_0_20_64_6]|nr:MAG: peptidase M20 [Elusimicrobia bacterium CG11_big_fil_rev_8_21_14_0_20_64_6]